MAWLRITLNSNRRQPAELEELLLSAGAVAITLQDAADQPLFEPPPGETPLWNTTSVTGLFHATADPGNIIGNASKILGADLRSRYDILEDKDWEREWIRHYKPMRFGQRLWICPSWTPPPDPDAVNVYLDPGLAFGTGTHPTTAMCLAWLDKLPLQDKVVIDYGCGSGILAIASLLLGARNVYAIDNDPQALTATRANAKRNNIGPEQYTTWLPEEVSANLKADILIANILMGPLINLQVQINQLLKPGGHIGLSGILVSQVSSVIDAYGAGGIDLSHTDRIEDWVLLTGQKTDQI